jgi:hypothetical protein
MSAIMSGYIAHVLAANFGPVGPFQGAVVSTLVALVLVTSKWQENYGSNNENDQKSVSRYMREAFSTITSDSKILRIGVIQGLTDGTLQTFVFLWSPALRYFSTKINSAASSLLLSNSTVWGLDADGEPAYGLIFGAFMTCGVVGGVVEPTVRKYISLLIKNNSEKVPETIVEDKEGVVKGGEKPIGVEILAAASYLICSFLLSTPIFVDHSSHHAFSIALVSFLMYEVMIGLYMPCEGVIRTIYMPNDSICSLMTMLRVIINVIVATGVFSTNFISFTSAFAAGSVSMFIAFILQLTLIEKSQWCNLSQNARSLFSSRLFSTKQR